MVKMHQINIDHLEVEELEQLRDEVNQRILSLRQTSGLPLPELLRLLDEVKKTLEDQGKEWFSLERWQYMEGEIRFWLNPRDQENYRPGWYSIDDLIAWTRNNGPVLVLFDDEDEDEEDKFLTSFSSLR